MLEVYHSSVNDCRPLRQTARGGPPEKSISILEAELGKGKNAEKKTLSLYSLWLDLNNNTFLRISPELIKLGKYAAFIINPTLFLNRIYENAKLLRDEMNSDPVSGFVRYIESVRKLN